jgi:basic membrane protein A and related proteins
MKMKRFLAFIAIGFLSLGMVSQVSAQAQQANKPQRVGFIYVGAVGQFGWTFQHDLSRRGAESTLVPRIQTTFKERVLPQEAEAAIDKLVDEGHSMIFLTSPAYKDAAANAARKHPKVLFELVDGDRALDNLTVFNIRSYEGRYVMGQIAGMVTKSNVIGYVAAYPVPEFVAGINAFTRGVQSVNSKAKVKVIWTNDWADEKKEAAAVQDLAKIKADVIGQHTYTTTVMTEAAKKGIKSFGQSSDMASFAPQTTLTSLIDHWWPYYTDRIQRSLDGKWTAGNIYGGVDADMIRLAPLTNVAEPVVIKAKKTIEELRKGFNPFSGPITRADGKLAAAAGAVVTEKEIRTMNWFVKGVDGTLPPVPKTDTPKAAPPAQKK